MSIWNVSTLISRWAYQWHIMHPYGSTNQKMSDTPSFEASISMVLMCPYEVEHPKMPDMPSLGWASQFYLLTPIRVSVRRCQYAHTTVSIQKYLMHYSQDEYLDSIDSPLLGWVFEVVKCILLWGSISTISMHPYRGEHLKMSNVPSSRLSILIVPNASLWG